MAQQKHKPTVSQVDQGFSNLFKFGPT